MADIPLRPRLLQRGGARNKADRISDRLTLRQCRQLVTAAERTLELGKGFNRFITISWELAGLPPTESVGATERFIARARDWFRARGETLLWAWVQERGSKLGAHVHILFHVPEALSPLFGVMPLRWVRRIIPPGLRRRGVLKTRRWRTEPSPYRLPEQITQLVMGRVHYMLKGAPPEIEAELGLTGWSSKPWGKYCRVYGKRLSTSRSCLDLP